MNQPAIMVEDNICKVQMKELIGSHIHTRDSIRPFIESKLLEDSICHFRMLYVDFQGVEFISRAFADEFYKKRNDLNKDFDVNFVYENLCTQVYKMLDALKRQMKKKPI